MRDPLLCTFLIPNFHHSDVFLLKQLVMFISAMGCFYGTAAALIENSVLTDLVNISDKARQLSDGPIELSCFTQRRSDVLI